MVRKTMMRMVWKLALLLTLLQSERASSANILALFPYASTSHNNIYTTITRELAQRGHNFTVVAGLPIDSPPPNYRQIDVQHVVIKFFHLFNSTRKIGIGELSNSLMGVTEDICRNLFQEEEVRALVTPKDELKFDLILMSGFFTECLYPFARIYNVPIVLISPSGPVVSTQSAVGSVTLPSFYAYPFLDYADRMNFKERVVNTLIFVGYSLFHKHYVVRSMEYEMRASFGEDTPSIAELEEHVSLAILNNHFSINQARPTVPGMIEAGGLHIRQPGDLPKDLKTFLDGAGEDGAIYFSLGSNLKSSCFPKETRDAFITAFSKLKQRVLWKWEGENPIPGQSRNVRLEKWLPQQDVLAHPNVKLFITHGGLLSFQEAVSRGVPIVGIPFYGDQALNMKRVLYLRVGVGIDAENITADNILIAIQQVLGNSTYSTNMKRLQSIFVDRKDQPLDTAVYWIEYVMRHKGAKHLKPAAFYLQWYQICMLDVLFVIAVIPSLVILGIGFACFKVLKKICRSRRKHLTQTKKTQ